MDDGYYPVFRPAKAPPHEPKVWFPADVLKWTAIWGSYLPDPPITPLANAEVGATTGCFTMDIRESPAWREGPGVYQVMVEECLPGLTLKYQGPDGTFMWILTDTVVTLPGPFQTFRLGAWPD